MGIPTTTKTSFEGKTERDVNGRSIYLCRDTQTDVSGGSTPLSEIEQVREWDDVSSLFCVLYIVRSDDALLDQSNTGV